MPILTAAPKLEKPLTSVVINVSSLREIEPTKTLPPPIVDKTANGRDGSSDTEVHVVTETKSQIHKLEPTVDTNQGAPAQAAEKTPNLSSLDTEIDSPEDEDIPYSESDTPVTKTVEKVEKAEEKTTKVPITKVETQTKAEGTPKADSTPSTSSKSSGDSMVNSGGIFIGQQKESVFMRLNNRIKDLELNMSLSSRYLEELSQRYKKQMDEMQKAFNKTITTLTENAQTAHNRDTEQQKYIDKLETQLAVISSQLHNATQRLDNVLREVIERHLFLMFIEIFVMSLLFLFCIGRRPAKIYIPVENGVPHTVKSPVENHVGHPIPAAVKGLSADDSAGRTMHASPRRRNRSLGECTPVKASDTNTGGGSCDDLLIIGHTTPFLEALQQANSPDGASRRKGRHKSRHKLAPKSSSTTAVPLTNGDHMEGGHRTREPNQAGLLFKGSARKDDSSPESSAYSILPNGAIKRLFSSKSIDRIEDLSHGGATTAKQKKVEQPQQVPQPGPRQQQQLNKPKQQKLDGSTTKNSTLPGLKHSSISASSLPNAGHHQKQQGKGSDKKSRSSPALQQVNSHQSGPGGRLINPRKQVL
ncbi:uncharacterized protein [Amphiura filiformis]|uniref:uncharacterized protein n=1 Tax=Amphiura filiformis TaxID=82378 RepID=UPI003B2249AD